MNSLKKLRTEVLYLNREERKSLVAKIRENIPFIYSDLEVCRFLALPIPKKYSFEEETIIYRNRGWTLTFNNLYNFWALHKWDEGFKGKYNPMTEPSHPMPTERDYE